LFKLHASITPYSGILFNKKGQKSARAFLPLRSESPCD